MKSARRDAASGMLEDIKEEARYPWMADQVRENGKKKGSPNSIQGLIGAKKKKLHVNVGRSVGEARGLTYRS